MLRRKPDWLLVLVGTLVGAAAGLFLALMGIPVHAYIAYCPPPFGDTAFCVDVFGTRTYTHFSRRPWILQIEMYMWTAAPMVAMSVVGAFSGWMGSKLFGRRANSQMQISSAT